LKKSVEDENDELFEGYVEFVNTLLERHEASAHLSRDYYEILGINRDATNGEIKKLCKELLEENHPDKGIGDPVFFKQVGKAAKILTDPLSRQKYDLCLGDKKDSDYYFRVDKDGS